MKTTLYAFVLIAAVCAPAVAQTAIPVIVWAYYYPASETTIAGTIQQVIRIQGDFGTHLMLDTPLGMYEVALGPTWFIENQTGLSLTPGRFLRVTGTPVAIDGWQYFVARQVQENGNTVTLRSPQGIPVWTGAGLIGPAMMQGQGTMPGQTRPGPLQGRVGSIYNPQTEMTVTGTVQAVIHHVCGPWAGSHAILDTPQGRRMNVQLGPAEYLSSQGIEINPGERLQVTGSRIDVDGIEVLLARSVSTGGRTVALRSPQGVPEWAGAMRPGMTPPRTDQQY